VNSATQLLPFVLILFLGIGFRVYYLNEIEPDHFEFAGDSAHHYNLGQNIYRGKGPVTDFVFSYWFRCKTIPCLSDFYPPGFHYALAAFFVVFGESILSARFTSMFFGVATIILVYLLGAKIYSQRIGLLSMILLSLNRVHIQHSVAVMTDVMLTCLIVLSIYLALVASTLRSVLWSTLLWVATGLTLGMATLTKSVGIALLMTIFLYMLYLFRKEEMTLRVLSISLLVLGISFLTPLLPWAVTTYRYFGVPLYSNANFTPITTNWVRMTYETTPPALLDYIQNTPLSFILFTRLHHIYQTVRLFPYLFSFSPLIFLFVPVGFLLSKSRQLFLPTVGVVLYYALILGAAGNDEYWRERYLLPMMVLLFPIAGKAIDEILSVVRIRNLGHWVVAALSFMFLLGVAFTQVRNLRQDHSRVNALASVGAWVKSNTSSNAVIMTKFVQDVHYYTQRWTVIDPYRMAMEQSRLGSEKGNITRFEHRSVEEIDYYDVSYVLVDPEESAGATKEEILGGYRGLHLELVYEDKANSIYLYHIVARSRVDS
jgi:hypothetical protein